MNQKSALGKEIYKGAGIGFLTFGLILILLINNSIPYYKINKDFNFLFHPLFLSMVFSNFISVLIIFNGSYVSNVSNIFKNFF